MQTRFSYIQKQYAFGSLQIGFGNKAALIFK